MSLFKYCVLCYSYISFDKNLLKILTVKMFTTKNNNLNGEIMKNIIHWGIYYIILLVNMYTSVRQP